MPYDEHRGYPLQVETRALKEFSSLHRLIAAGLVAAALVVVPSAALARTAANPSVNVNYSLNGNITAALPDGTQVGATSGSPTVIAAGWYVFQMIGPGGCASIPQFILKGPGLYLSDNLDGGETNYIEHIVHLLPNSTYTWSNDAFPSVTHTFQTNSTVLGSPPPDASKSGLSSSNHTTVNSTDLAGSNALPFRGTLTGAVNAAGRLTLSFKGKSVSNLMAGTYTIRFTDKSSTAGLVLQKLKHSATVSVSGAAFIGTRTKSLPLSAGTWFFMPGVGKATYAVTFK
jgi:hypothetical protein